MKKYAWIYLSCFCLLFFLFSSVYYFSYKNLELEKRLELAEGERGTTGKAAEETETDRETTAETESGAVDAGKKDELTVTGKVLYVSQSYDEENGLLTETILPLPEAFLGLTREELADYLKENDSGKNLVSFSSSRIVVRAQDKVEPADYKFLLLLEDGYLKVYYSDKSDVYMETYLTESELPASELSGLKKGCYIKSESELYDYLESITS